MDKVVRLGCIGAGGFSWGHMLAVQKLDNAEIVAIADIREEQLKEKVDAFGFKDAYLDYHDLLARDDIDAVLLPLPDQVHCQVACDAMRAGKHVLCEKPMALSLDECKEMIRVSDETGKQLMIGQVGRYTPAYVKGMQLVQSGTIGKVFFIGSEYAHDYSNVGGRGGWRVTPEREPIIGGGCHAVDLIRMIMGENPTEISAFANNMSLTDWPIHDCCVGIMKFPSGAIGKVMTSTGCKRKYTMRTCIYGTEGTIILDNSNPIITIYKEHFSNDSTFGKEMIGVEQQKVAIEIPVKVNSHNLADEIKDFCNCLLEGRPVTTPGREGAATVAVCTAVVESFKTGKHVIVDYNF